MTTAKVFQSGNNQAACLPEEFRFDGDEVCVKKSPLYSCEPLAKR